MDPMSDVQKTFTIFLKQVEEGYQKLEQERKELDAQKEIFQKMTKKLEGFQVGNRIVLNVGGTRYETSAGNLLKAKDSFFSAMFSGVWKLQPESDGSYFIDRDGTNFRFILNYFRDGELTIPENDKFLIRELLKEAEFYQVVPLIEELQQILVPKVDSLLLAKEHFTILDSWLGGQFTLNLLYRGSRDGFSAQNFHSKCDNKGKTISIIKDSNKNIFGGFASQSWSNAGAYQSDPLAFIFTLKNPYNIPPTKLSCKDNTKAIYFGARYGPVFGNDDITIDNQCDNSRNTSQLSTFPDTSGKGEYLLTAQRNFTVSEIEVFEIQ